MPGLKVFAPASVGNIGVGFDIMGLALERPGDEVIVRTGRKPGLHITKITGHQGKLPMETEKNTAGVAALRLLEHLGESDRPLEMEIHKKMPLGSGLGSSGASAVAGVFAVSEWLRTGLSKRDLLHFACQGEQIASGGYIADNVAPSLLGGIILIRDAATLDVHRIHVPKGLYLAVVHPHLEILTREARAMLRPDVPLRDFVRQSANVGGFITGLFKGDIGLIGRSLQDCIIEPQRAGLIPGFYDAQKAALEAGALGCSISGAGPAVFALCDNSMTAENAGAALQAAFESRKINCTLYLSAINQEGAVVC